MTGTDRYTDGFAGERDTASGPVNDRSITPDRSPVTTLTGDLSIDPSLPVADTDVQGTDQQRSRNHCEEVENERADDHTEPFPHASSRRHLHGREHRYRQQEEFLARPQLV